MNARREYRDIFIEHNGPGPWPCYGCGEPVIELLVHHLDWNHDNDEPNNLTAMHPACHARLHRQGWRHTVETKEKMSASAIGKHNHSPETRAKIAAARRGKPNALGTKRSPEQKERIGAATASRPTLVCPDCGATIRGGQGNLRQHRKGRHGL